MRDDERKELHKRIWTNLLVSLAILLAVIFIGPRLISFFMPLIIAWILATIVNPIVVFLENKIKIMRKHGSAIVIVLALLLVGSVIYMAIHALIVQIVLLVQDLPEVYGQVMLNLQESLNELHQKFHFIPGNLQQILDDNDDKINEFVFSFFDSLKTDSISAVGNFASSIIDIFVLVVLTLMISYFFVAKRDEIRGGIKKYMPQGIKNFWNMAMDTCLRALAGYIKACFQIMIIVFIILFVIFGGIMHVKYASLLALLTAFLDFLPFLGTGIIITPWAIYCAITGEYVNVIILVVTYVICLLAHRLLEPKLVGDSVGMSPFATLISMFIGYRLIGMLGLILGIPVGMVIMAFREKGMFESYIRGVKILAKDIDEYRKY
ncbi:sporulation integral membrane protein YtvI [bacterium 1xD8-6]|jgi:sporulation integral membrane protein YtvI|nr:sporulation integral membrane protein YtvI [bacterium D16-36]RKI71620.1 sporulation integral membrane protein YtvI [bacterium 1xD8-6]